MESKVRHEELGEDKSQKLFYNQLISTNQFGTTRVSINMLQLNMQKEYQIKRGSHSGGFTPNPNSTRKAILLDRKSVV